MSRAALRVAVAGWAADPRWSPPHFLVLDARSLFLSVAAAAFLWTLVGGETVTCRGDTTAWVCERRSEAPLVRALGFGGNELSGPERLRHGGVLVRRTQYAARVIDSDGDAFRLPWQRSEARADEDMRAFRRWVRAPRGTLVLTGPGPWWVELYAIALSVLVASAAVATLWVHLFPALRPPAPPAPSGPPAKRRSPGRVAGRSGPRGPGPWG